MDKNGYYRISSSFSDAEARLIRENNINRLRKEGGIRTIRALAATETRVLIIPVQFSDVKFSVQDPQAHFDRMMNTPGYSENGGTGSVSDYFTANVPDMRFIFDVTGPVTLDNSLSYYGENDVSTPSVITYDVRIKEMVREACTKVNGEVDFSRYDNDGDGYVDYLFLYFAGYNEAESGNENSIWPQTYNISTEGIRLDGVMLDMFACSSELSGSDLGIDGLPSGIGMFCHEFSHFLGLVDLYDTDYGNGGLAQCLWGSISIMDTGNNNNNGRTPPYYCAIDRELAGSASYMDVRTGTTVTLEPINREGKVIRIPTTTSGEYYLIENREETGWDAYIGGSGMLVYHIDKSRNIVDGITASVRWSTNLVNTYAGHECADLVEAFPKAGHISQVFFPGQADITEFSAAGDPAFIAWDGTPIGIKFANISKNNGTITFDIMEDNTEILLTPSELHIKAYQNMAIAEWDCGRPGTYRWGVMWGRKDSPEDIITDTVMNCKYTFSRLTPKTDYRFEVYHIGNSHHGDTVSMDFSTSALTSPYPYIVLERAYSPGDTLNFIINNLTEDLSSCIWYINGTRAITDNYIFRSVGTFEIEAVLRYSSDGSEETIRRTLTVSDTKNHDNTD